MNDERLKGLSPKHLKMLSELPSALVESPKELTPEYFEIFWEGQRDGNIKPGEHFVPPACLPVGFKYPASYREYVQRHPVMEGLGSWGYPCDLVESSATDSEAFGRPLVEFAQAFGDDMVACFEGMPGSNSRVLVLNPWAPYVITELENFEAWLTWARQDAIERGLEPKPARRQESKESKGQTR